MLNRKFVLASASPRRKELLSRVLDTFEIDVADIDEHAVQGTPNEMVKELAYRKAKAVFERHPDAIIIGSDTIVTCNGKVYGKPVDKVDAKKMLEKLQGQTHVIYTGLCIMSHDFCTCDVSTGEIVFAPMTDSEIDEYIGTGEPMGKAGAYAVQGYGGKYIQSVSGDWYAIVGLPLRKVYETISSLRSEK